MEELIAEGMDEALHEQMLESRLNGADENSEEELEDDEIPDRGERESRS